MVLQHFERVAKAEVLKEEMDWARTRSIWVVLANANRDPKKKATPFEVTDLVRLSFDKKEEKEESQKILTEISDEEFKRIKERYTKNG